MESLTVLIADDHPLFRKGLRALLDTYPEFTVVAEAASGREAVERTLEWQPDVVLMDLQMPDGGGVDATRRILHASPRVRVLVVSLFQDDDSVFAALRAGARGYVLKDTPEDELIGAVRTVGAGGAIFSPAIAARVLNFFASAHVMVPAPLFPGLTDREREILHLMAAGHDNHVIAGTLGLSVKTVSNYVSNIFAKLEVANRAQAIVRARDAGLGSLE
ncbi:response regulator [Deinococcus pimensis]|uniref:response regulator n=1 Tax=Deinococcus pimensis TaxID=309888 RepID=UPI000483761B|nr:response regulator transcription factor [Deinococcus pimensis]